MISAVILTRNEDENVGDCIKSLFFCDEIVIVDDESTDETVAVAKRLGASVFIKKLNGNLAEQRNFGFGKAKGDWVLFIDADERVSADLREEILMKIRSRQGFGTYKFKRKNYLWGRWIKHGEMGAFSAIRLVKKGSGEWVREVHEYFSTDKKPGDMKNPILHYPHPNMENFVAHINLWSTLHASSNLNEGKKSSVVKIIFYPIAHFLKNFIFRGGFLDGIHGFVVSFLMAFHSYLAWSKQWVLQKQLQPNQH